MHYTPKSGWFPCKAKGSCPKGHISLNSQTYISKSYSNKVEEIKTRFKSGQISKVELTEETDAAKKDYVNNLTALNEESKKHAVMVVPRDRSPEHQKYFQQTDIKHFGSLDQPGSKFTDTNLRKIEDVISLAYCQRGHLEGDDRDKFIALGADPAAFNPNFRYIYVKTEGTLGIKNTADLADDTMVHVVRTKDGAPCNVVVDVKQQDKSDYGVVILASDKDTQQPLLITTFPGLVTKNVKSEELDKLEGQTVPVKQIRSMLGDNVWANTRIV